MSALFQNGNLLVSGGPTGPFSFTINAGTVASRFVAIKISTYSSGAYTFSNVKCNSNAMSAGALHQISSQITEQTYYLSGDTNIASGNNTVLVTVSGTTYIILVYGAWSGVDSATGASAAVSSEQFLESYNT